MLALAMFSKTLVNSQLVADPSISYAKLKLQDFTHDSRVRACINVLIESVHKICLQNLSKIKLCDWPNKLDATSWQVLNTTESVGMDRF